MGRAISLKGSFFAGVRVAGELTYIPAHIKNGKKINSRVIIPIYANSNRGTDQKTGEQGRSDEFKLVAWGKLADVCCKSLPKGKAIDAFADPQSYIGKKYNADGSLHLDVAGMPIEEKKVAFTIMNIVFGEESTKVIAEEIQKGRRPINWNVPNHPDFQMWIQILQANQAAVWDGRSPKFGYARVIVPQGPGIQLDFSQNAPAAGFGAPGYNAAPANYGLPGMVANAFGGNPTPPAAGTPLFDPMTGRPLAAPATPQPMFDPMTGKPLNANPGFPGPATASFNAPAAGTPLF